MEVCSVANTVLTREQDVAVKGEPRIFCFEDFYFCQNVLLLICHYCVC